jgi:hypothetical protein
MSGRQSDAACQGQRPKRRKGYGLADEHGPGKAEQRQARQLDDGVRGEPLKGTAAQDNRQNDGNRCKEPQSSILAADEVTNVRRFTEPTPQLRQSLLPKLPGQCGSRRDRPSSRSRPRVS